MDLAKLDNDKFKLTINCFDLTKAVTNTLDILADMARQKEIEFEVKIDKERHICLYKNMFGDQQRFEQILMNIVSNSLKFTPNKGKITILIRIIE